MKPTLFLLALLALAAAGCGPKQEPAKKSTGENPLTAPADYVGAIGKAQQSAIKTVATASLDQAIKMFQEEKGRLPTNLTELVTSGTLPKLPAVPNGMKFDYDAASGKVKIVPQ
ncbi:MAG: hypothetical protein HZA90_06655 [Verrucomicrobia bacterium]|nr:hypothetical protein [Verrucomicrobiota bacterium]